MIFCYNKDISNKASFPVKIFLQDFRKKLPGLNVFPSIPTISLHTQGEFFMYISTEAAERIVREVSGGGSPGKSHE